MHENRKVGLVTGAARRIGAEIAKTLHNAGFNLALHYNASKEEAEALQAELNKKRPDSAILVCGDLNDISSLNNLIVPIIDKWQRLDVLVNNASRFYKTHRGEGTEQAWDDLFTSNLKAPYFLTQCADPHLRKQKGCVINITDIHGELPLREYPIYCMTKAGLIMQTKAMAKELGPDIRVNAVSPGAIIWPEGENELSDTEKQKVMKETVLKAHGDPADIAKAVLYFVQDAGYVTGQVLAVDGGRILG